VNIMGEEFANLDVDVQLYLAEYKASSPLQKGTLTSDILKLLDPVATAYADFTFITKEGTNFPIHSVILYNRSTYFKKKIFKHFKNGDKQVILQRVTARVLKSVIYYCYGGIFKNIQLYEVINDIDPVLKTEVHYTLIEIIENYLAGPKFDILAFSSVWLQILNTLHITYDATRIAGMQFIKDKFGELEIILTELKQNPIKNKLKIERITSEIALLHDVQHILLKKNIQNFLQMN